MGKDITDLIERFEAFEKKAGIKLEGLYAEQDQNNFIFINGEIHALGEEIIEDIELTASAYDSSGRVLRTSSTFIEANSFLGFEIFSILLTPSPVGVSKIRIYAKSFPKTEDFLDNDIPF